MVVLSITDKKNGDMSNEKCAVIVGSMITLNSCAFSYDGSNAINPARDFAPRLFTLIAGWGSQTFSQGHYFFWIPLCTPFFGSFLGALIYFIFISNHL